MPYQLAPAPNFLRITFFGRVTRSDFGDALREWAAVEAEAGLVPDRLTDLVGVESSELSAPQVFADEPGAVAWLGGKSSRHGAASPAISA